MEGPDKNKIDCMFVPCTTNECVIDFEVDNDSASFEVLCVQRLLPEYI